MTLVKVQWQFRYPYSANPDGYYYWTNAYFKDVPDPMDFPAYVSDMEDVALQSITPDAQINWLRVQSPPEAEPPLESVTAYNHTGYSPYTGPTILQNVARVNLYVGDDYVGYRLLRAAIPTAEIADYRLSDGVRAHYQTAYADLIIANEQTTRDGVRLTRAVVTPDIHHWQLRTGTKRRQRGVLHTP